MTEITKQFVDEYLIAVKELENDEIVLAIVEEITNNISYDSSRAIKSFLSREEYSNIEYIKSNVEVLHVIGLVLSNLAKTDADYYELFKHFLANSELEDMLSDIPNKYSILVTYLYNMMRIFKEFFSNEMVARNRNDISYVMIEYFKVLNDDNEVLYKLNHDEEFAKFYVVSGEFFNMYKEAEVKGEKS